MKTPRRQEGFNVAFLDIMACGLGAIILVFMIVKQNVENSSVEIELLQSDLARLTIKEEELRQLIIKLEAAAGSETAKISSLQKKIARLRETIKKTSDDVSKQETKLSSVRETIKNTPRARKADVIKRDTGGEENYIMGLRVEGSKIAILLDTSSSMTDEKLIDIIRRKNASDKSRQNGPKWKRAKRIVEPKPSNSEEISDSDLDE